MIRAQHDGAAGLRPDGSATARDGGGECCHDARVLTEGGKTATIVLDGQSYVLRITRAGKLILTK